MYVGLLTSILSPGPVSTEEDRTAALYRLGVARLELGDAGHAIEPLREAVTLSPHDARARVVLGHAYLKAGRRDEAERAFREAVGLDAGLAEAHVGMGLAALKRREERGRAGAHFEEALRRDPHHIEARYHLERTRRMQGGRDMEDAARAALGGDSTDAVAHRMLAEVYEREGEVDRAAVHYGRYLALWPGDAEVRRRLAMLCLDRGDAKAAQGVVRAGPDSVPQGRDLPILASARLADSDGAGALALFEAYLAAAPEEERRFYQDISLVASPEEVAAYQKAPEAEREAFLRRFWLRRDPALVSGVAGRRAEHLRRVWYARTHFSQKAYPWDRRGEVYIRYGEPDHRVTSRKPNHRMSPAVQRVKEQLAVNLYGPDAVGEVYPGPVFPIRSSRALSVAAPEAKIDLDADEREFLTNLEAMQAQQRQAAQNQIRQSRERQGEKSDDRAQINPIDQEQEIGAARQSGEVADPGLTTLRPTGLRRERFIDQSTAMFMPVTSSDNHAAVVPWETWVYTGVGEGFEVTFTDEYMQGNYDFAPVPTHVPQELRERHVAMRDIMSFVWYSPEVTIHRAATATSDFYRVGRGAAPFDFSYYVARFRGASGSRAEVYWGVGFWQLGMRDSSGSRLEGRMALVSRDLGRTYEFDEEGRLGGGWLRAVRGEGAGQGRWMVSQMAVEAPPGDYDLAVQVREGGTGRLQVYRQPVTLEDYRQPGLRMSDVEVACGVEQREGEDRFTKNGLRVLPMPGRAFRQDMDVYLYFEVYNLRRDATGRTRYRVTYTVRSQDRRPVVVRALAGLGQLMGVTERPEGVSVVYEQAGTQPQEAVYVGLDVGRSGAGAQEVTVRVEDLQAAGQGAERRAHFLIAER
ncbi:MAG: hypothetical protein A3F84_20265 [Candidatus Handelsmanbacteria bacterium RIFCSPLOWO2_12_FULL_64_10]|uniref:Uncharacterized protein n=1 Tax=Handelsmanbacteria sp. (strain RIFCSPLOWO2_12_FULL_64_10) TaxID=1817868 RepID=A0A1F6CRT7_HANXR|nr:MAG: hypothetical protein A3F84_20265 [Candidatus Handelsmanbacteria bacterium RIFCSPLOWO2_12_FULL_64_10]